MICHRDSHLLHLHTLGLQLNGQKSVLTPAQQTTFLGVCLDSISMQARLAPVRVESIQSRSTRFRLDRRVSVGLCHRLLDLMAVASPALSLGLLHMRLSLHLLRVSGSLRGKAGLRCLVRHVPSLAHKWPGVERSSSSSHSLSSIPGTLSCHCQDRQDGGGVSHQLPAPDRAPRTGIRTSFFFGHRTNFCP